MGNVLSAKELHLIDPYLSGFNPSSLALIVWDSIGEVGQDDKDKGLGIHFSSNLEDPGEHPMVTFWDENGVEQLPRKVFLEILQFLAESTLKKSSSVSGEYGTQVQATSVHKLKLALDALKAKLAALTDEEGGEQYNKRVDSGIDSTSNADSHSESFLEELRAKNASYGWVTANDESDDVFISHTASSHHHSPKSPVAFGTSRGIEGVVERLPELRSRYEAQMQQKEAERKGLQNRVMNKIKALSVLKSATVSPGVADDEGTSLPSISRLSLRNFRGASVDQVDSVLHKNAEIPKSNRSMSVDMKEEFRAESTGFIHQSQISSKIQLN